MLTMLCCHFFFFFFQAEDGIRDLTVTGVQTCALPISISHSGFRRPDCFGASGSVDIATTCRLRPCSGECSTSARQPCHFLLSCINRWGHLTGRTEDRKSVV